LRVLPASIRPQISLAYLLARTTDTIADTELVRLNQRLATLDSLRQGIMGGRPEPLQLEAFAQHQGSIAERTLLEKCGTALDLLRELTIKDRESVQAVLQTIISGQELDLRRFADGSPNRIIALKTPFELDDYTYRVAGCVGEFWTRMCRRHVFPAARIDDAFLLTNGVRFGKGLQLVNVLRDLPNDLRLGRCYLPADELKSYHLDPADLLDPGNQARVRPVYNRWLDLAENHLAAGWSYTEALPRRSVRIRLACAWPLLIGVRTIELLRSGPVLDPARRIKITRGELRRILWRSVIYYPWASRWERLYQPVCISH
jgi:farnesyl-diphosphate farnesyltransferase